MTAGLSQFGMAAGSFIQQEDMADGNYSHLGAASQGALKGASMGAALGPWGALAGAAIGGIGGLLNRDKMQAELDAEAEAKRKAEEERERALELAKKQANDAVLAQYPVKGTDAPRYNLGGSTLAVDTDPKDLKKKGTKANGQKYTLFDLPKEAMKLALDNDNIMKGIQQLNEDELTAIIGQAAQTDQKFRSLEGDMAKLKEFKNMDLSWVKPLREKTGLSKKDIINAAANSGLIPSGMKMPVLAASALKDFRMGGATSPQYRAEGGEMIQHKPGDVPTTDKNGSLNRMTATEAEITGDKHSAKSGGVGMSDKKGARIYSDQLTLTMTLSLN